MRFKLVIAAALGLIASFAMTLPSLAHDGVKIEGAYARFLPGAKSGAVYMDIANHSLSDDRLIAARSPIAAKVDLHASVEGADGMMSMQAMAKGVLVPGLQTVRLGTGRVHLMFTGLTTVPQEAETFPLTLVFERSGEITLDVTVENRHKADASGDGGMTMDHEMAPGN